MTPALRSRTAHDVLYRELLWPPYHNLKDLTAAAAATELDNPHTRLHMVKYMACSIWVVAVERG